MESINKNLDVDSNSLLEDRIATELEERIELTCWAYCGTDNCTAYN